MFYFGPHIKHVKDIFEAMQIYHEKGFTAFQFFLTSPKRRISRVSEDKIKEISDMKKFVEKTHVQLFIHSPYTLNFARLSLTGDAWFIKSLVSEIKYAEMMGVKGCIVHLGKSLDLTIEEAYTNMLFNLKSVIKRTKKSPVKILLETSACQGTELGCNLRDFAKFYHSIPEKYRKRIGICVDTCHVFSAGYDLRSKESVKEFFTLFHTLFRKKIDLFHLNDSATPLSSHIDRHAELNNGYIKDGLKYVVRYAYKNNIPLILETPRQDLDKDKTIIEKWISKMS